MGARALVNTVTNAELEQTLMLVRRQARARLQASILVNRQPRLAVGLGMGE